MNKKLLMVLNRLREPSTWAGLGLIATGAGWTTDETWSMFIQVATGAAGLLAIVLRESASEKVSSTESQS